MHVALCGSLLGLLALLLAQPAVAAPSPPTALSSGLSAAASSPEGEAVIASPAPVKAQLALTATFYITSNTTDGPVTCRSYNFTTGQWVDDLYAQFYGTPASRLYASLVVNSTTALCPSFDPPSKRWLSAAPVRVYDVSGNAPSPDPAFSQQLASLLCSDPNIDAAWLVYAVNASSSLAKAAAAAVEQAVPDASCRVESALLAALNIANPQLDPASLPDVQALLQAFVQAADAQGLAACGAYAVVDAATGQATSQHFHTGSIVAG
ncbi:hypothetical protein ABPG75_013721 [Micractinium tetrahymenae]